MVKYSSIGENFKRWNKRDRNNWTNKATVNVCVEKKSGMGPSCSNGIRRGVLLTNRIRELCLNKMNKTVVVRIKGGIKGWLRKWCISIIYRANGTRELQ